MKKQVLFPTTGNLFTTIKGGRSRMIHSFSTFLLLAAFVLFGAQGALGQISLRGSAISSNAATTNMSSIAVDKPTGVVSGDIMIVSILQNETDNDNGGLSSANLSGWTLIDGRLITSEGTSNGNNAWYGTVLYRVANGTEGSSFTFTLPNGRADMALISIVAFSGVTATGGFQADGTAGGPFDVDPGALNVTNASTSTASAITSASSNSAIIMLSLVNNDRTFSNWIATSPSTFTELYENTTTSSDDGSIGAAWNTKAVAGTTGDGVVTLSSSDRSGAILLALKPCGATANAGSALNAICKEGTSAALGGSVGGSATGGTWSDGGAGGSFSPNATTLNATYTPLSTYTGTVTLTLTSSGGGCSIAASKTLTVTAPNAATISYTGSPFCRSLTTGQAVTRTGTAGGTYTSTTGLSINSSTGAITPSTSTAGTYTVTYTMATAGGCSAATATTSVTITTLPNATITYAGSPFCKSLSSGQLVTLTGSTGGTYTASSAGLIINSSTGEITPSTSTAGTYTVTYTMAAANGCAAQTATTSVTINAQASATISYAGSPFCSSLSAGQLVTRTGTTGGTYTVSPAGLTINPGTGAITPSTSTAGTYTVTYTVTPGGCSAFTTTTSVTITALPVATIIYSGAPFCSTNSTAQSVTLTGTSGGTYSSTAGLSINTSTGAITPSSSTAGTYTVTYTMAAANGCAAQTATASVTINAEASATITYAGSPFCRSLTTGQAVTRTGTTGGTYTASPGGLIINSSTGAITPSTSIAGTYTVTYTVTPGGCSAFTTTTSVTITPINTVTIASTAPTLCINTALTNITHTTTGATGIGTATGLPAGVTAAWSSNTLTIGGTPTASGTFNYSIPLTGGCGSVNATGTITVSALPTAAVTLSNSSICAGSEIDLTSTVNSNNSSSTIAFNGFESGNTWGYTNSTTGLSLNTGIVRTGSNSMRLQGSDNNNNDPTITFDNISLDGYTNISLSVSFASLNVDGSDDLFLDISYDNGSTWISTKLIDGSSNFDCSFDAITTTGTNGSSGVVVNANPYLLSVPSSSTQIVVRLRFNESANNDNTSDYYYIDDITLTGTPNASLSWVSSPTGFTSSEQNPTDLTPSENTTYTVTATNAFGCTASESVDVTVNTVTASSTLNVGDRVWNGNISNDYTLIENWSQYNGTSLMAAQTAPTSNTNVIIPNVTQTCVFNTPSLLNNTVNSDDLTIELDGELTLGTGNLNIRGNYTNNGSLTPGTGTISFMGTSGNQTITKAGGETFAKMKINKAAGNVILANNLTVSSELSLVKGLLVLGSNDLILGGADVVDHTAQSYIQTSSTGKIKRNVGSTGSVFFPVGNSTYNPAELTNTIGSDVFSVSVVDIVYINGTSGAPQISSVVNRTWLIEEGSEDDNSVKMKLYWNGADEQLTSFNPTNAFVAHYVSSSSMWDNLGGTVNNGVIESSQAVSSFSPFTISSSPAFAPLPVELMSLDAQCAGENVIVAWKTASEHNSLNFVVERSEDGTSWSEIQMIAAAGNSNAVLEYAIEDEGAARGLKYYRLIQTDQDGAQKIYGPVMSNCGSDDNSFISFPNPGDGELTLVFNGNNFNGTSILHVRDANGRMVRTIALEIQAGTTSVLIPDMELTPGVYYLQLEGDNYKSKVIKHSLR